MKHIEKTENRALFVILIFAACLYLYKLGSNPPGLFADEASTGYNIYSLIKTTKDEYGKFLPFGFRQLGSYTPPLYIYLSTPFAVLFGLSSFSTRILSAFCGLAIIALVFKLLKEYKICKSIWSLFFTTLFLSITPWLVFFSRMGYEQNLAFLFFVASVYLFTKSIKDKKYLIPTIPVMSLATYADFPLRYLMPVVFVVFLIVFRKNFRLKKVNKKAILAAILIAAIIQVPNLYLSTTKSFWTKGEHFYSDIVAVQAEKINNYLPQLLSFLLAFTRELFAQYSSYFSPRSLFFEGDPDPQRSIPELSVFYPWMIVLYLVGLYLLFKKKPSDTKKIIVLLLFLTPLTGAFTRQPFHVQRTLAMLLPLTIIMGMAIDFFFQKIGNVKSAIIFSLLFFGSFVLFWRSYFILLPQMRASTWAFQWRVLSEYIKEHKEEHYVIDQVLNQRPENIAYYQLALYLKIDPKTIQDSADPKVLANYYHDVDFSPFRKFQNMEFKPIEWGETVHTNKILVGDLAAISDDEVKLHNLTEVFVIKDPNDTIILRGFKTNPIQ